MNNTRLGAVEARFANIIWNHAPIPSGQLAVLAEAALGWKKSTTYTVLKRLCNRGLFQNHKGTVTVLVSHQDFYAQQSEQYINEQFNGSLPAFVAAFGSRKKLSESEIEQLQALIDKMRG